MFQSPHPCPVDVSPSCCSFFHNLYSSRFEKEVNKTRGLFHVWLGLYANLLVAFFSFVFLFLLACGPTWVLGIRGFGGLAGLFCF